MKVLKFYYTCIPFLMIAVSCSNSNPLPPSMASTKDSNRFKEFEAQLEVLQEAVDKVSSIIDGNSTLSSDDYMRYYTVVYNLCVPNPLGDYAKELYDKYKEIFEEHITSKVLPSLREKKGQVLLQELVTKWANYKIMTRWLSRFFHFIERYFIPIRNLPSLQETSFISFRNLVYGEMNDQIRNATFSMINREREGEQIDQTLVKSVLAIYIEMGMNSTKYYEQDFEEAMVKDTAAFYSVKASNWIQNMSYKDYMLKVEHCQKHEKGIVSSYQLQDTTQKKLLQVVEHELLDARATELEGMKQLDNVL